MECPKCGGSVEMMVDLTILAPSEMESDFTKKNLRKKGVKLYAVNWSRASYFCRNNNCRWGMIGDKGC